MRNVCGRGFFGEWFAGLVAMALLGTSYSTQGQELKLRYTTGSEHGFVILRDTAGAILASGEVTQVPSKQRITLHVVFHFRDG
jgi:outer membrane translocation and assembly module TamA